MKREIRIGSRESDLAITQSRLVMSAAAKAHPELSFKLVTMKTQGDCQPERPMDTVEGKDFFTGTLEQALLNGKVDLCVHSLKDMPDILSEEAPIVAFSAREDPRDALILPADTEFSGFPDLYTQAPVGCSSVRRRLQLLQFAPRLQIASIRGNVPTRIAKLDAGQYGATVLAMAGLVRLGLQKRASRVFSVNEMIPAAGQGILAVQGRRGEDYSFLNAVNNPISAQEAAAERIFISTLECGCSSPAAAYARIIGEEVSLLAMFAPDETQKIRTASACGSRSDALRIAEGLARRLQNGDGYHG